MAPKNAKAPAKAAKPAAKAPAKAAKGKPAAKPAAKKGGKAVPAKAVPKKGAKVAPKVAPKPKKVPLFNKLFASNPKDFGIGNTPLRRDVTRFVRWPQYVLAQRQKRVLQKRLKIPPSLNQFDTAVDSHTRKEITKLASKYKPQSKQAVKERLREEAKAAAEAKKAGKKAPAAKSSKRASLKCGIQLVTRMVEKKKAKLVLIAHDVDPIEVVIWLPALCRQMEVPYCIVKGKSALGKMVGLKTAAALAFTNVKNEDQAAFKSIVENAMSCYNNNEDDIRRQWGGLQMGRRSVEQQKKKARLRAAAK